jgi:hypothetical protein
MYVGVGVRFLSNHPSWHGSWKPFFTFIGFAYSKYLSLILLCWLYKLFYLTELVEETSISIVTVYFVG